MKAVVHHEYGEPEVLTLGNVEAPLPGDDDVLIRVVAAGASIGDHHIVTGKPYLVRLSPFCGFPRPKHRVPGAAMSGRVVAVGAKVTGFDVGDEVFGQALHGAFAEFLVMPAELLAHKPKCLSFEDAAAIPWGTTALQGLRDTASIERLRMEVGRRLLSETRTPVKRIAQRCGFGSEETMRGSFLRLLSVTPRDHGSRFAF